MTELVSVSHSTQGKGGRNKQILKDLVKIDKIDNSFHLLSISLKEAPGVNWPGQIEAALIVTGEVLMTLQQLPVLWR